MQRIKQLLTMRFDGGVSTPGIPRELGVAPSKVCECLGRAAAAGICWLLAAEVNDESLMGQLSGNAGVRAGAWYFAERQQMQWPSAARICCCSPKRGLWIARSDPFRTVVSKAC